MTTPLKIEELDEVPANLAGTGPHTIETHIAAPSTFRSGAVMLLLIKDVTGSGATDGQLVYRAAVPITVYGAGLVHLGTIREDFAAAGWTANGGAPTMVVDVVIVDDELYVDLEIPAGYTVQATYRIEGVST